MNYPLKLQVALTQACIDIHNANNINGIDDVLETQSTFESAGYHFPKWLSVWIRQLETDPLLTAEEYFKKPIAQMSGFENMSFSIRYTNEELIEQMKIEAAIRATNDDHHPAQRSALYVIASQILSGLTGHDYDDGLSYEWHCKTNETQSLTDLNNFLVFVAMLKREIAFWQDGVKSKGKMPPKLQHYHPAAKNM